jgi:hypothetical protein
VQSIIDLSVNNSGTPGGRSIRREAQQTFPPDCAAIAGATPCQSVRLILLAPPSGRSAQSGATPS